MWIAKFKIWHKNCLLRPKCMKYQIEDLVYLLNSWTEKRKFYYTELHILEGTKENKEKFIKELKKEKSVKKVEKKGNYIFTLNEEPISKRYYSPVFDPKIIQIKPVVQRVDGFEDWELASWDRKTLMKIMEVPVFEVELKSIKEENISEIFLPNILPKLSKKQKQALNLAIRKGYYNFPRKINLDKLAKISKISKQTFQENLRKAENKLIPFLVEKS